jgi:homopolymeric O-antigen transport system permease protein
MASLSAASMQSLLADKPQTRPVIRIRPSRGLLRFDVAELWSYRQLLLFLVWRDVKVRYKQTAIGVAWAILQPVLTAVIFAIVFGRFAGIPSDGVPYALFAFAALVPWNYFAQAIARGGASLVGDANLLRKIYFPRLIIPAAAAVSPLVDAALSLLVLFALLAWYGIVPTLPVALLLPALCGLAFVTALGVSLWLSALNVRYRDVGHAIPFLAQLWMYASPVAYPVGLVPEKWRPLYGLNPMAGVIEGFRWTLLGTPRPDFVVVGVSAVAVLGLLASGVVFFRRMERTFADVV